MIQWCDELPAAFRQKTGSRLRAVLPALFHAGRADHSQAPPRFLRRAERSGGGELLRTDRDARVASWVSLPAVTCCWKSRCCFT